MVNVIVRILLLHFRLQVPWEKFWKSYLTLKFFVPKIATVGNIASFVELFILLLPIVSTPFA